MQGAPLALSAPDPLIFLGSPAAVSTVTVVTTVTAAVTAVTILSLLSQL